MTAFMSLVGEDLDSMFRSATVWLWLAISGVGGLSVVIFAGTFDQESTSFLLGWFACLKSTIVSMSLCLQTRSVLPA